ncbi:hypothetical protein [Absidia glauca]|uniref:Uncharacterized protein n=1 Tax=Absidia glauca TaxID=4829 RepID=A0A163LRR2_ABSGL|nr:hypothetical protein [Absidia glauca]
MVMELRNVFHRVIQVGFIDGIGLRDYGTGYIWGRISKWRRTKTAKLCKSIQDSSGRVWAKNCSGEAVISIVVVPIAVVIVVPIAVVIVVPIAVVIVVADLVSKERGTMQKAKS